MREKPSRACALILNLSPLLCRGNTVSLELVQTLDFLFPLQRRKKRELLVVVHVGLGGATEVLLYRKLVSFFRVFRWFTVHFLTVWLLLLSVIVSLSS